MKFSRIYLTIILLAVTFKAAANDDIYGLQICSFYSMDTEATGLALDAGKPFRFRGRSLTLSFDLCNRGERPFGCILRMIAEDGNIIDLMNTVDQHNCYRPQLVVDGKAFVIPADIEWDKWVKVTLTIDTRSGTVTIDYAGEVMSVDSERARKMRSARMSFGNCFYEGFTVNSVASISIRDICLLVDGTPMRKWPLMRHSESASYDEICSSPATAVNPIWLSDSMIALKPVFETTFPHYSDVAYDGKDTFIMTKPDGSLLMYDVMSDSLSCRSSKGGAIPSNFPNQIKWCNDTTLLSYSIAQNLYGEWDFERCRWNNSIVADPSVVYWNVSCSWDPEGGRLYSFGGYGFYHFSNILRVFSPDDPLRTVSVTLDRIAPRFFSSSAVVDSCLFIFGGEGSVSGNQGITEDYYYDLYKVDLSTFEETELWSMPDSPIGKFIPGENLVYDAANRCFYTTAITEKEFIIVQIGMDEASIVPMSLPAGVRIDAPVQYTNLYIDDKTQTLYAVFIQSSDDRNTKVNIMSMSYPPCPVESILIDEIPETEGDGLPLYMTVMICILCIAALSASAYFILSAGRRRSGSPAGKTEVRPVEEYYDFSRNSICFLGGFSARNRDGEDITAQFSPTLRKLLVALIFHTVRYEHGILGEKLNQLIWDYKPEGTASNNRNVYISRLRAVLDGIDGVSVNTKNKFLSISFSDEFVCDYKEVMRLGESPSADDVGRLLSLLFRGLLLPNMDEDWVEDFRSDFISLAVTFLSRQLKSEKIPADIRLQVADTIMLYDSLDESVLRERCSIYRSQGNLGLAKEAYDAFCRDYKATIGDDYKISFKDIIS